MKPSLFPVLLNRLALLLCLTGVCLPMSAQTPPTPSQEAVAPSPAPGQPAPNFRLTDTEGKAHSLAAFQGKPVVLFFFCGCEPCHRCALTWSRLQRSQPSAERRKAETRQMPPTLVVLTGDVKAGKAFLADTGLDPKQTFLLPDSDMKVALAYDAAVCPRVFVLDDRGVIRYTNDEAGGDSHKIPPPLIVARTVGALERLEKKASVPPDTKGTTHETN